MCCITAPMDLAIINYVHKKTFPYPSVRSLRARSDMVHVSQCSPEKQTLQDIY